jgi:hypothetical protein
MKNKTLKIYKSTKSYATLEGVEFTSCPNAMACQNITIFIIITVDVLFLWDSLNH